jgi:hypothetical protein
MIVFGESTLIIKEMVDLGSPGGNKFNSIISPIKQILSYFEQVLFYHIKREMNGEVDHWEKVASYLGPIILNKNGVLIYSLIP